MREPWLDDGDVRVWHGNALDCLRELPSESVQMILTSPPFFGLRDYGTGRWEGGDGECDHKASKWSARGRDTSTLGGTPQNHENAGQRGVCRRCGARRVDDQIGIEATPEEWVEKLVGVLREARRVLRADGCCWIEVGDTYTSTGGERTNGSHSGNVGTADAPGPRINPPGLKPKDLIGAPWMLAFALRADGWWLRAENIWHKRNPMPESVTDRTTRAHSQVFLLSKAATYFYDADAIAEEGQDWSTDGPGEGILTTEHYGTGAGRNDGLAKLASRYKSGDGPTTRNARSVWEISTATMKDAHFAVMPDELAEKCIKAGTSEHGACVACGAPWRRVVAKGEPELRAWSAVGAAAYDDAEGAMVPRGLETGSTLKHAVPRTTVAWEPTCEHAEAGVRPCVVLDPFLGSGTTAHAARRLGRHAAGVELSAEYLRIIEKRLAQQNLLT